MTNDDQCISYNIVFLRCNGSPMAFLPGLRMRPMRASRLDLAHLDLALKIIITARLAQDNSAGQPSYDAVIEF